MTEAEPTPVTSVPESTGTFRLLSYNIQVGIATDTFPQYFTGGWKHLLPHKGRLRTLAAIADQMRGFDLVAVQEADAGSLRTGYLGQTEYLARQAGYPWWGERTNRRLGRLAQHSIGALAQTTPTCMHQFAMPGRLPGRGSLALEFGTGADRLMVVMVHLALGRPTRRSQLDYVADWIEHVPHAVVMGDFNAPHDAPEMRRFFARTALDEPAARVATWPAWRPQRNFDHILTTPDLGIHNTRVLAASPSDHLPIAVDVVWPKRSRAGLDTVQPEEHADGIRESR